MCKNTAIYEIITKKVIEQLEHALETGEQFQWIKEWNGIPLGNAISYLGKNFIPYRGINRILLDRGLYITYSQLQEFQKKHPEVQFKIRKGCKQHTVYFYKILEVKDEEKEDEIKNIPLLRFYKVYKITDIENLPKFFEIKEKEHEITDPMKRADEILSDYCKRDGLEVEIVDGSDRCFYRPSEHKIYLPKVSQFHSAEAFYEAVFHEAGHSTSKALKRDISGWFGSEEYGYEELVAELTANFVCSYLEIETNFKNSVAYLQGWLEAIKGADPSMIAKAATAAQKASDYILNIVYDEV